MITTLGKHRYLRIAGFAMAAVVVATGAVLVTASASGLNFGTRPDAAVETASINSAANSQTACTAFMKHLAVDLGKSQADINKAVQKAIGETLTDQVNSKELTQAQADAMKQKLASQNACALIAGAGSKPGHGDRGRHGAAYMQQYLSAAAAVLNISDAQLKTNLSKGQTLSQMATPKFTLDTFRTALISKLQPQLDTAVKNNQMTSAQEQAIINQLKTGALPYWDKPMHTKPVAPGTATSNS
jgi:lipoate-protein ligase A